MVVPGSKNPHGPDNRWGKSLGGDTAVVAPSPIVMRAGTGSGVSCSRGAGYWQAAEALYCYNGACYARCLRDPLVVSPRADRIGRGHPHGAGRVWGLAVTVFRRAPEGALVEVVQDRLNAIAPRDLIHDHRIDRVVHLKEGGVRDRAI